MPRNRFAQFGMLCVLCGGALMTAGCLERRISITSEPPGALVWVNDVEIGRTPVDTDFTFYGDFDVRLRKDGYEPITTHKRAGAPWYEIPPFDLVATALPFNIDTDVTWHFDLKPQESTVIGKEASEQGAIERAKELREKLAHPQSGEAASQHKEEASPEVHETTQPSPAAEPPTPNAPPKNN